MTWAENPISAIFAASGLLVLHRVFWQVKTIDTLLFRWLLLNDIVQCIQTISEIINTKKTSQVGI